jgi:hypothetical protein
MRGAAVLQGRLFSLCETLDARCEGNGLRATRASQPACCASPAFFEGMRTAHSAAPDDEVKYVPRLLVCMPADYYGIRINFEYVAIPSPLSPIDSKK